MPPTVMQSPPPPTTTGGAGVLIVGAGPVGMTLACELASAGVAFDIISRRRRWSPHSRATIIWPRVLEVLDRTGLADPLIANGHYFDQMNYYSEKKRIGVVRFDRLKDAQYPYAITCPQWKIEEAIERRLNHLGHSVQYGSEFISGRDHGSLVDAQIRGTDGTIATRTYRWVVGADGYHSTIRETFGFSFAGQALRTRLAITDAEIHGETTSSEAAYYLTKGGNMVIAPLGDGVFRVGTTVPVDYTGPETPDKKFFEDLLAERVPGNRKLGKMRFSGIFNANVRSAEKYRKGRVILVGDAAHAMSPSGAQGLNTGLQDAVNLGWKLAGTMQGRFPERLIDTFDSERRPAVAEVTRLSSALARIGLYESTTKIVARDTAYRAGTATGALGRYLAPRLAQLTTHHGPQRRSTASLSIGQRLPVSWRTCAHEPELDLNRYTIFLWPGHTYRWQEWKDFTAGVARSCPEAKTVDLAGRPPGRLSTYLDQKPLALICRPDGHLEAVLHPNTNTARQATSALSTICAAVAGLTCSRPTPPVVQTNERTTA